MPDPRDFGFGYVLVALWLASEMAHLLTGARAFGEEQAAHGQAFAWGDYLNTYARDSAENYKSEWAQLFVQVAGLKYLLFKGSPQSKDGDEEMRSEVRELRAEVRRLAGLLERAVAPAPAGV
jgi:hypothetical protein